MTALEACEKTDNIWSSCFAPLFWKGFINRRKINRLEKTSETLSIQFGLFSILGVSCWKSFEFHKAILLLMFICPYSQHAILISILRVCICCRRLGQYDYQNRRKEFRTNETLVSISIARRQNKKSNFLFNVPAKFERSDRKYFFPLTYLTEELEKIPVNVWSGSRLAAMKKWWITSAESSTAENSFLLLTFLPSRKTNFFHLIHHSVAPIQMIFFLFLLHHKRVSINNFYKSFSRRWKRNFQAIKKLVKMVNNPSIWWHSSLRLKLSRKIQNWKLQREIDC